MPFSDHEKATLLAVKGVGNVVIARLEQLGLSSFAQLSTASVDDIVSQLANKSGSTCWKNSPQARAAIKGAIVAAQTDMNHPD